jgi:hypothetical protein
MLFYALYYAIASYLACSSKNMVSVQCRKGIMCQVKGKILKELSIIGIKYLTQLFNAFLLKGYFPAQWKVVQIILILKPGKPPNELTSYWSISLLPIASKVFEKLLLKRLLPVVENNRLIPNHQFSFRQRYPTI